MYKNAPTIRKPGKRRGFPASHSNKPAKMGKIKGKVLVIDDDYPSLAYFRRVLEGGMGFEFDMTQDAQDGVSMVRKNVYDLLVTDLMMPGLDGMEVLEACRKIDPDLVVIMITANDSIEAAVKAIKQGAFDYIVKPVTPASLEIVVERALEHRHLYLENRFLRTEVENKNRIENIVGNSPQMQEVYRFVRKVAQSGANIMIHGESGTGKELIARAVHSLSPRSQEKFVPVDCAVINGPLLESELFGHERGSFTGAERKKIGLMELADKGTLFLDEVGELILEAQVKLLRALQERSFRMVGGEKLVDVDIRIISATNRKLEDEVREGNFREDLYHRLQVISIALPPLRKRKGDVPLLAAHFLRRYGGGTQKINPEAMELLDEYSWPGNVRELENVIQRALALADDESIKAQDLPSQIRKPRLANKSRSLPVRLDLSFAEARAHFERHYVEHYLSKNDRNISRAAKKAKIDRKSFWRLMQKHGINGSSQ